MSIILFLFQIAENVRRISSEAVLGGFRCAARAVGGLQELGLTSARRLGGRLALDGLVPNQFRSASSSVQA